ncbi:MAG: PAS domain S-box protein [Flavobacteriales bacterium]|nr:PAS domain S-box protein [Flavobacteriales bacterium]
MKILDNISIKNKVLVVVLIIVIPVLIAQTLLTINRETKALTENLKSELATISQLAASYCAIDLHFEDKKSAAFSLSKINNFPEVKYVELVDINHRLFAKYSFSKSFVKSDIIATPIVGESILDGDFIVRTDPVLLENKPIGYVIIYASTEILDVNIGTAKLFGLLILTGFIFLTLLVGFFFQKIISAPIVKLANFTKKISKDADYSERFVPQTNDEITVLAQGVNAMLQTIEETTVSKNLVDKIINSMGDSLVIIDSNGFIKQCNPICVELLKYPEKKIVGANIRSFCGSKNEFNLNTQDKFIELTMKDAEGNSLAVEYSGNLVENNLLVCVIHDVSERKKHEEEIKSSLKEKEVMIKEIHHRVKNNLQIVSSLLNLQSSAIENEETRALFTKSKDRISAMALIHAKLYNTNDLVNIDVADYIESLSRSILITYNGYDQDIKLKVTPPKSMYEIDTLVPVGLMLNELITNSVKYAFTKLKKGCDYYSF